MVRRIALTLMAVTTAFVVASSHSSAQEYGTICEITVTPPTPSAGQQATVDGTGFEPDLTTQVIFDEGQPDEEVLAEVTTDNLGEFTVQVTIPADADPGLHTITALCDSGSDTDAQTDVLVLGGGQTPEPTFVIDPNLINCAGRLTGDVQFAQGGGTVTFTSTPTGEVIATVSADEAGRAQFVVADFAGPRPAGTYTITSSGNDFLGQPFTLDVRLTITKNNCVSITTQPGNVGGNNQGGGGRGQTPRTGSDTEPLVAAGAGAILAGTAAVLISRRRRNGAMA